MLVGGKLAAYIVNALRTPGTYLTKCTLNNTLGFWSIGGKSTQMSRVDVDYIQYDLPPDWQQNGSTTLIETNGSILLNTICQFSGGGERDFEHAILQDTLGLEAHSPNQ